MTVHGPTGAPCIVLVHGSVVSGAMWAPQVRALRDEHRVIVPDLPGHGAQAHRPFTMDAAVDAVLAAIEREAPGGAVVVGMSLGGYVAMAAAARRPAAVRGLVLSGATVAFRGLTGLWVRTVAALMARGWFRQSEASAERRVRAMFPAALAADADAQLAAGVHPETLAPALRTLASRDARADLAAYPGPVLFLNGARDRAAVRGQAAFAAVAPQARVELLAGAGHASNLDAADAYSAALRRFLAEVAGAP